MRKSVTLIILSLFGILFLTSCSAQKNPVVDASGKIVGEIQVEKTKTATILDAAGKTLGHVRGDLVRDASGKKAGSVTVKEGHTVITDASNNPIGSVEKQTDCYGKSQKMLGAVQMKDAEAEVAGAACLLLFLR